LKEYLIRPFKIMEYTTDWAVLTYLIDIGKKVQNYSYLWYIEGPKEKIVVDTSSSPEIDRAISGIKSKGSGPAGIRAALQSAGLRPDDIDIVINTHLHFDHCGNNSMFRKARVIAQKDELEFAYNPIPTQKHFYRLEDLRDFEARDHELVDGDKNIVEGVRVLKVPGHTLGMQAVTVETSKGIAAICSDSVYRYRNWYPSDPKYGTPVKHLHRIPPGHHVDLRQWFESMDKVEKLADIIIPGGEPELDGKRIPIDLQQ